MPQLLEIAFSDTHTVDHDAGVIRGVKVLGRQSRNGREYSDQALHDAARLYEGIGVNLNHADTRDGVRNRPVEAGFGWLAGVAVRSEGVFGDLHYFKSHPQAAVIVEAAERNPRRFGLSHNAEGRVAHQRGKNVVESIEHVRSVDLVQNPATNAGLFESEKHPMPTPATDVLPAEQKLTADELTADNPTGDGDGPRLPAPPVAESAPPPVHPDPLVVQLIERIERLEIETACRELLESHDRACDGVRLKALAALTSADERVRLIESWPERAGSSLLSGRSPRPTISRPLVEADSVALPKDARALAAAIR
jgi:hypothetical protein